MRKAKNLTDRFSFLLCKNVTLRPVRVYFFRSLVCPRKNSSRLATLNGVTHRLMLATFLITSKAFVSNVLMHKIMAS